MCVISPQESIDITIDVQNRSLKPFPIGKGTDRDYVLLVYLHNMVDIVHTANYLQNPIRLANIPRFEITCWLEVSLKLCATTCAIQLKVVISLFTAYILWTAKVWRKFNQKFFIIINNNKIFSKIDELILLRYIIIQMWRAKFVKFLIDYIIKINYRNILHSKHMKVRKFDSNFIQVIPHFCFNWNFSKCCHNDVLERPTTGFYRINCFLLYQNFYRSIRRWFYTSGKYIVNIFSYSLSP